MVTKLEEDVQLFIFREEPVLILVLLFIYKFIGIKLLNYPVKFSLKFLWFRSPFFRFFSCQDLPFGISFGVLTLKVSLASFRPLAPLGGVLR